MRILTSDVAPPSPSVDQALLERLYAWPEGGGVRANFVSSLDGAATGADGLSGSINNPADGRAFAAQRRLADAVVVGAGTARAEGYHPLPRLEGGRPRTLVVVSGTGRVPESLSHPAAEGEEPVVLLTSGTADGSHLAAARALLGADRVWQLGDHAVDLAAGLDRLRGHGARNVLCEGGPSLFGSLLAADLVNEVALTYVPTLVGGDLKRVVNAGPLHDRLALRQLLEEDGTLLTLWTVRRDAG